MLLKVKVYYLDNYRYNCSILISFFGSSSERGISVFTISFYIFLDPSVPLPVSYSVYIRDFENVWILRFHFNLLDIKCRTYFFVILILA